jgi:hypothetical protein
MAMMSRSETNRMLLQRVMVRAQCHTLKEEVVKVASWPASRSRQAAGAMEEQQVRKLVRKLTGEGAKASCAADGWVISWMRWLGAVDVADGQM